MNSKIVRTLAVAGLVMTLALVACLIVLPYAHAAPSSTTPTTGSSVAYGPSGGTKGVSPDIESNCFADVYAYVAGSNSIGEESYTDCTPGAYQITQDIDLRECLNSNCTHWNLISTAVCNTGTGGVYSEAECPANGGYFFIDGLAKGHTYDAWLTSCADFIALGWGCGEVGWEVPLP